VAGLALGLYGVRSARNWGCGDFTDLERMVTAFAREGAHFIALNPLHALSNRQPYNISPYLPLCSLYRNFLYLDVERAGARGVPEEVQALRASEFVEYERVAALKLAALRTAFKNFSAAGGDADFEEYVISEGESLRRFAVFQAIEEDVHRRDPSIWLWKDWPEKYRHPESPAVDRFAREHDADVRFYQFLQWQIDQQLASAQARAQAAGMRIGLYHDLALATDHAGADVWMQREYYVSGCRVGSPPDAFAPSGQDWAFPPPDREAHRRSGYEMFARLIRANARHGGALRMDHVMRLFRLYWIPDGMSAAEGAYVRDHAAELLAVLARESERGKFVVIGEDLGTVAPEVRETLAEAAVLGCRVLWFEKDQDGEFLAPEEYPPGAAVSTTTHDLATLAGFFTSRDIVARHSAGLIDDENYRLQLVTREGEKAGLHAALEAAGFEDDPLGFMLATPCALAVVNQEDLTGEPEQPNLPASTWQHPNWRRKMRVPLEDIGRLARDFGARARRSGR
jgi:4-alpha-glucanotransferase